MNLGILFLAAAVNFVLLFPLAKHAGVETVAVPTDSPVTRAFDRIDYADAYRATVPPGGHHDIDSVTRAVLSSLFPCWIAPSERERVEAALRTATFQTGASLGDWKVYQKAANEIILGADENHLDFRLSILLSDENGARWFTISTVVHFNNWKGTAYFIPVRVGHKIIVPHAVRTAVYNLR